MCFYDRAPPAVDYVSPIGVGKIPCGETWNGVHRSDMSCPPILSRKHFDKVPIPQRPQGQWGTVRQPHSPSSAAADGFNSVRRQRELVHDTPTHGRGGASLSFLPGVLGFQFGNPLVSDEAAEQLSPEQVQQAFLSRLLLLLGSFVILCLLLF